MNQSLLFDAPVKKKKLETYIRLNDKVFDMPEGLHTIPCTHGLHRFAGKFVPNIPRYVIRDILPREDKRIILDPFCGSGTALVEASLEGRRFVGMDIDPLAVMISKAKTTALSEQEITELQGHWERYDYKKSYKDLIPQVPNLTHWFSEQAINELSSIKMHCLSLPEKLKTFCLIVFSSIIRRVSNADDQTQKTYVSHTLPKSPPLPSYLFPIFLQKAVKGMREFMGILPSIPKGKIILGDARKDIDNIEFHDVITSPPYIDSIDYVYNQMLEYYWLMSELGIGSHLEYRKFRKQPMGLSTHTTKILEDFNAKEFMKDKAAEFILICKNIREKSRKEDFAVRSFFYDYVLHANRIRSKQRRGDYYVCIVGNSFIRGYDVPTAEFIKDIHQSNGYILQDELRYEIKRHYMKFPRKSNSGKIIKDYILIFRAD